MFPVSNSQVEWTSLICRLSPFSWTTSVSVAVLLSVLPLQTALRNFVQITSLHLCNSHCCAKLSWMHSGRQWPTQDSLDPTAATSSIVAVRSPLLSLSSHLFVVVVWLFSHFGSTVVQGFLILVSYLTRYLEVLFLFLVAFLLPTVLPRPFRPTTSSHSISEI